MEFTCSSLESPVRLLQALDVSFDREKQQWLVQITNCLSCSQMLTRTALPDEEDHDKKSKSEHEAKRDLQQWSRLLDNSLVVSLNIGTRKGKKDYLFIERMMTLNTIWTNKRKFRQILSTVFLNCKIGSEKNFRFQDEVST